MTVQRYSGYVTGARKSPGSKTVWSVRVKDAGSEYNGKKLIVASTCGGLELARGLNVNFAIGTVDDQRGQKALRAVDVCLEAFSADQVKKRHKR